MARPAKERLLLIAAWFHGTLSRERGQTLAEYALIVTLISVGVTVLGMIAFRTELVTGFNAMSNCLNGGC